MLGAVLVQLHLVLATVSLAKRPEILPQLQAPIEIGNHYVPVQFENDAISEAYANQLHEGIIKHTKPRDTAIESLEDNYPFMMGATLAGLPFVSEATGLPLDKFLDMSIDPQCNAFIINAVVIDPSTSAVEEAWPDHAMPMHLDTSLVGFTEQVQGGKMLTGSARTVVVLSLNDVVDAGGELEVYNARESECENEDEDDEDNSDSGSDSGDGSDSGKSEVESDRGDDGVNGDAQRYDKGIEDSAPCLVEFVGEQVHKRCGENLEDQRDCIVTVTDRVLAKHTLARLAPRKRRLVQFDGRLAHGVRLNRKRRVTIVFEQFDYPPAVVDVIPTLFAKDDFPLPTELDKRFGDGREKGSRGVNRHRFQECLLQLRKQHLRLLPDASVRKCVLEASSQTSDEL